jgi:hypothetical protein
MLTILSLLLFPMLSAIFSRYGVLSTYAAAIISYTITKSLTVAVACYLAVLIGGVLLEYRGTSNDPDIITVSDLSNGINIPAAPKNVSIARMLVRAATVIGAALIFGSIFPRIPVPAVPWFITVAIFGGLLMTKASSTINYAGAAKYIEWKPIFAIGGLTLLLVWWLKYEELPVSTTLISLSALSSLLLNVVNPLVMVKERGGERIDNEYLRWSDWLFTAAVAWLVPGLTPGTATRCLSSQPKNLPAIGGIDALLEGWTLGAWVFHGNLSGKTMLGESIKSWTWDAPVPYLMQSEAAFIVIFGILLAVFVNIVVTLVWKDMGPDEEMGECLPLFMAVPIISMVIVTVTSPLIILYVFLLALGIAIFMPTAGLRNLALLFIAA